MRAVVQRVLSARVEVASLVTGAIDHGLVAFVGAGRDDTEADVDATAAKVCALRVFSDDTGRMSRALADTGGALLVVSQFTVYGDVRRGLRPSFDAAMEPVRAEVLYERFVAEARRRVARVETGRFRADMRVFVENDGPVTILVDSTRLF